MKIKPIKISIENTEEQYAINMYITASDSWGNEEQNVIHSYDAVAILTDINNVIRKRLFVSLTGDEYSNWDGSNNTILKMFLKKYDFLELN